MTVIPNAILAKLFVIAFGHVFPQCAVTMQVGDVWESTSRSQHDALASRAISARDVRLEEKIISFRSGRHPGAQVIAVTCVKVGAL